MSAATVSPEVFARPPQTRRRASQGSRQATRPLRRVSGANQVRSCAVGAPSTSERAEPWLWAAVVAVVAMFLLALVVVVQGFWSVSSTPQSQGPVLGEVTTDN